MYSKLRYIRFPALSTSQLSCHNALHTGAHLRRRSPKTGPQAQTITILTCTSLSLPDPPQPPRPPKPPPPLRPNPRLPASPFATALSSSRTQTSSPSCSRTTSSGRGSTCRTAASTSKRSTAPATLRHRHVPPAALPRHAAACHPGGCCCAGVEWVGGSKGRCGSWIWCMWDIALIICGRYVLRVYFYGLMREGGGKERRGGGCGDLEIRGSGLMRIVEYIVCGG